MALLNRGGDKKKKTAKAKPEKAKKKKRSSSGGGISAAKVQEWLMLNVEKIVLGLIGLAVLVLIYSGFRTEGLKETEGPEELLSKLTNASSRLQPGGRDELLKLRYPEPDTFDQQATKDILAVDPSQYALNQPFFPLLQKQQKLRQDPELLPPTEILVRSGYGPLMLKAEESALDAYSSTTSENERSIPAELNERWNSAVSGGGKAEPVFFNSIVGIVPVREQLKLYNEAFIGAAEYDLSRDFPRYMALKIDRREKGTTEWQALNVMEKMTVEPLKWTTVLDSNIAQKYIQEYIAPIIMPIPPIAGTDMNQFVNHPKLQTQEEADREAQAAERALQEAEKQTALHGTDTAAAAVELTEEELAFKKLENGADIGFFRYFDFDVEPGKDYEYRVKLVLEDPNNPTPESGSTRPSHDSLDPKVLVRLADIAESGELAGLRETAWTEPTSPIHVPLPGRAIIGRALAGKKIRGTEIPTATGGEPIAEIVAIGFDLRYAYVAPVLMNAKPGMLLNRTGPTEVIDPSKNKIRKLENYENKTGIIVIDIDGGDDLTGNRRDPLRSPGRALLLTADGQFVVTDEVLDKKEFKLNVIPEDEELARENSRREAERRRQPDEERNRRNGGEGRSRRGGRRGEGAL